MVIIFVFNSYSSGVLISLISYVFSAYSLDIVSIPLAFVTAVLDSPVSTSFTLYVAPAITLSVSIWYFVISRLYFSAILNPNLFGSVCVLYFPASVSNAKYTAWWLYATWLNSSPSGNVIV